MNKLVLRAIAPLGNVAFFAHLLHMLVTLRERGPGPERTLTARDVRAFAYDIHLPPTAANLLALMLAIGTGRFVRVAGS